MKYRVKAPQTRGRAGLLVIQKTALVQQSSGDGDIDDDDDDMSSSKPDE